MILQALAGTVVTLFGLALVVFGVASFVRPDPTHRFLRLFAGSARAHYTEQALRLAIGAALVVFSSSMHHPEIFEILGWVIGITAIVLFLVPWRWHRRFGELVIPLVIRYLPLYAIVALALGVFVLYGVTDAVGI